MRPIVTDRVAWSVAIVSPAKKAELIEMPFGTWTQVGQMNHVLDRGADTPCKWAILMGEVAAPCEVQGLSAVTS